MNTIPGISKSVKPNKNQIINSNIKLTIISAILPILCILKPPLISQIFPVIFFTGK